MGEEVCMLAVQILRLCKVTVYIFMSTSDWERVPVSVLLHSMEKWHFS